MKLVQSETEIFVVDLIRSVISRVLPFWQGHRVDAQFVCNYSAEETVHRETPIVQPPPQERILAALSRELLEMPVGQQPVGLLLLLRATVPSGQLRLVHPLGVD